MQTTWKGNKRYMYHAYGFKKLIIMISFHAGKYDILDTDVTGVHTINSLCYLQNIGQLKYSAHYWN